MSAISATGSDLTTLLQSLNANQTASNTTTPSLLSPPTDSSDPNDPSAPAAGASGHHHHHAHQLSSKLESAITSALSADDGKSDPNTVVQNTIKQFLAGNQSADGTTTNPNDPSNPQATTASTDPTSDQSSFQAVLQSYGINASQFQQDLHSAVQNGDGKNIDFAQLFQSLPVGSSIDTTA